MGFEEIFAAIFLIPTLYIIFNKKKILPIIIVSSLSGLFLSYFAYELITFFDPNETGNSVKLGYIPDYAEIFSDLSNFFFGFNFYEVLEKILKNFFWV